MFKKTLVAVALAGASISFVQAADVEVYGVIDTGLAYTNTDATYDYANDAKDVRIDEDEFRMDSGNNSASRFGIRGSEDLGNGMQVLFKLENGFKADDGSMSTDGTIFDREASLGLRTGYGTLYAGRMSTLISDTGTVGFFGAMASPFGSGWSDNIAGHTMVFANYTTRMDNVLTYVSPDLSGLTVYAQYAMGENGVENKSAANRYAALGAEYKIGAFDFGALVDWTNKSTKGATYTLGGVEVTEKPTDVDDAVTVSLAGSYDCGFAKTFLAVQYYNNASDVAGIMQKSYESSAVGDIEDAVAVRLNGTQLDGYGVHLGTQFGVVGGTLKFGVGYSDGDGTGVNGYPDLDVKAYTASLGYEYPLSKRTFLYTGAGYVKAELDMGADRGTLTHEYEGIDVVGGLVHKF